MKQVLFVSAGQSFPKGPLAFLRVLQQNERVHARALFFQPVDYTSLSAVCANSGIGIGPILELEEKEKETIASHKAVFARQCEEHYIPFTIDDNDQPWDRDLLVKESRFADLILISGELFDAGAGSQPSRMLQETLHAAECPVLIIPETFTTVEHLYIAYDGSRESCYAIKQFCHLFPTLIALPTEVVYMKEENSDALPDLEHLKRFTKVKFNSLGFSKLHFNAAEYFATWIGEKQHALLISGSFGRSAFSYAAKSSFAENVIREHALPVFIAHP